MRFLDFRAHFKPFRVFSIQDVRKWDPDFDTRRLVEWQKKKYLSKIINRWYLFSDEALDETLLYLAANRIYSPSYVSFESALSYYQLIPERVFSITSATTLPTKAFETPPARFAYRHLRPELFFGYHLVEINGHRFKIAESEKVMLDHLYLNSSLKSEGDLESLRLNKEGFTKQVDVSKLRDYLALFQNKQLEKRVTCLLNTVGYASR